ncbi:MAG: efflux RND transporter periplasmic adaptor subunit [Pirellulaceae bacterium]
MPSRHWSCSRRDAARGSIFTFLVVLASGCHPATSNPESADDSHESPRNVAAVEARLENWPKTVRVQGSLLGDEHAVIGAKIPGRVDAVQVDLGSVVHQGQLLVQLDQREHELQVQQAEAQLRQSCAAVGLTPDQSEADLDRENAPPVLLEKALLDETLANYDRGLRLMQRDALSDTEFARLKAAYGTAQARYQSALNGVGETIALVGVRRAELALAEERLAFAKIVAPFDAVVEHRHVSAGEYLQVGQPIVSLVRADKLRFTAGVPESKSAEIRPGQAVRIYLPDDRRPLDAEISRVSPALTQTSRALWIEADVPNPDLKLRAGLFAEAEIIVQPQAKSLTVPARAVAEFAGIQKVWVVRDGEAREKPVRVGRRDVGRVEILEGLEPGDVVVGNSSDGRSGAVAAVTGVASDPTEAAPNGTTGEGLLE